VIDKRLSTLLGDRNMLHGVMMPNKVVDKAGRLKKKCLVLKVKYEKGT